MTYYRKIFINSVLAISASFFFLLHTFADTRTTTLVEGHTGIYTSIALDSSDSVHISYYDEAKKDLKYATDAEVESD